MLCVVGSRWLNEANKRLVAIAVAVGLAGTASAVIGEVIHSILLIGGQGYRALWLIEVLALPLGLLSVHRLLISRSFIHRWAAFGVFIVVADPLFLLCADVPAIFTNILICWILIYIAVSVLSARHKMGRRVDAGPVLFVSCYVVSVIISVAISYVVIKAGITQLESPIAIIHWAALQSSRTFLLLIGALLLLVVLRVFSRIKHSYVYVFLLWIALSSVTFLIQKSTAFRSVYQKGFRNAQYVLERIGSRSGQDNTKCEIYWPAKADLIWFKLNANSYFSYLQTAGALFSEELTLEAQRRAMLTKPFELSWINSNPANARYRQMVLASVKATGREREPGREDILRLASDPLLDWIVLDKGVKGIEADTNGYVYVYNCSKLRDAYPAYNDERQ